MSSGQTLALIHPQSPWPGVQFFCTTRAGGVGRVPFATFNLGMGVGDNVATVAENRRRLRQVVPAEPYWLRQVHGWRVMDADAGVGPQSATAPGAVSTQQGVVPPEADAAITTQPGRVLAILTADCLPVVLADTEGRVLGVAHAGWRGLAGGVLEATLQAMRERCPEARAWRAWIGPGIGASAFQVGDDVRRREGRQDIRQLMPGAGPGGMAQHGLGGGIRPIQRQHSISTQLVGMQPHG